MREWEKQASIMVEDQIVARNIRDERILRAMGSIPRHLFVPEEHAENAYIDRPLPIGKRQTISQPYMVGKMTELLEAVEGMKVLEIGTGSGYQAAVLAAMGLRVWSLERIASLAERARKTLAALSYDVTVIHDDGQNGWAAEAPYDRLLVTAASLRVEPEWEKQLIPGGRLVVPLDVLSGGQRLLVREKLTDGFQDTWHDYCRFVPVLEGVE